MGVFRGGNHNGQEFVAFGHQVGKLPKSKHFLAYHKGGMLGYLSVA